MTICVTCESRKTADDQKQCIRRAKRRDENYAAFGQIIWTKLETKRRWPFHAISSFIFSQWIFHATMHYTGANANTHTRARSGVYQNWMEWKISCTFYAFGALQSFRRRLLFAVRWHTEQIQQAEFHTIYFIFCCCWTRVRAREKRNKLTRELRCEFRRISLTSASTSTKAKDTNSRGDFNFPYTFPYLVTDTLDCRWAYFPIGWNDPCPQSRAQNAAADSQTGISPPHLATRSKMAQRLNTAQQTYYYFYDNCWAFFETALFVLAFCFFLFLFFKCVKL